MLLNIAEFIKQKAESSPDRQAIVHKGEDRSYAELWHDIEAFAEGLLSLGLAPRDRVCIFLEKRPEMLAAAFGAAYVGGAFVPINPVAKPTQVAYIAENCQAPVLVTSAARLQALSDELGDCPSLRHVILVDGPADTSAAGAYAVVGKDHMA